MQLNVAWLLKNTVSKNKNKPELMNFPENKYRGKIHETHLRKTSGNLV